MKPRLGVVLLLSACSTLLSCAVATRPAQVASPQVQTASTDARPRRDGAMRTLFDSTCAPCHGTGLAGARAPSLFNPALLSERSDSVLRRAIETGNAQAGMPGFMGVIEPGQLGQLVAYIRNEAANLAERPPFVASPDGQIVQSQLQSFRLEVLANGLDVPWGLAFLPDGRLLITERSGRMRVFDTQQRSHEFIAGLPAVHQGQDAGLFDVVVHPDYARNGWIYIAYAESLPGYVLPPQPEVAEPGARPPRPPSMTVVIRGKLNNRNEWTQSQDIFRAPRALYGDSGVHYGSRMVFDQGGHLYFSLGERGNMAAAQDLASPLGKVHRVNDDGSVPQGNPFAGRADAVQTIWSYGHRNPQGLAFDPASGLLWESEHGPSGGDEINLIEPGKNYGWGVVSMGLERGITAQSAPGMIDPVVYYTPTIAPSGIAFYTADRYPGWKGNLLVAGLAGQQLRRLHIKGRDVAAQEVLFDRFGRTRAVAVGPDGLLYALLQNPTGSGTGLRLSDPSPGILVRLVPVDRN